MYYYVYVYVDVDVDVYTLYIYNMYTGDIPYKPRAQNHAVQGTQPFQLSKNPIVGKTIVHLFGEKSGQRRSLELQGRRKKTQ